MQPSDKSSVKLVRAFVTKVLCFKMLNIFFLPVLKKRHSFLLVFIYFQVFQ